MCGTDPVVGSSVKSGSSVKLILSKGPESDNVTMPNIVGIKEAVALDSSRQEVLREIHQMFLIFTQVSMQKESL